MVEKMNKIHLLMTAVDAKAILVDLQNIGVVHIETSPTDDNTGVMELQGRISALRKTCAALKKFAPKKDTDEAQTQVYDIDSIQKNTREAISALASEKAEADRLRKELSVLNPWGRFRHSILSQLEEAGVFISFHVLSRKAFEATDFTDRHIEIIRNDTSGMYFVELRRANDDGTIVSPLFPEESLSHFDPDEIKSMIETVERTLKDIQSRLRELSFARIALEKEIAGLEFDCERKIAGLSLREEADGAAVRLTGYIPQTLASVLMQFTESRCIVPLMSPSQKGDVVPIMLKNGPVARLFEPITKIFGLPQYVEIDPTPFFAPFFAFFFGFCLADVGYGIIVAILALVSFFLLKKKTLKSLSALIFLLGLTTIVGGVFLNTLFGMKIDRLPNLPAGFTSFLLFRDINDAMTFSILLGVIQILLGFTMQIVNKWRQNGFVASLQPAGTFLLIIGAGIWAMGKMEPGFSIGPIPVGVLFASPGETTVIGPVLTFLGVLLILLFNNFEKKIWIRPFLGLWEMYGIASGIPGDILSYIRLFALSLAGGLLGGAINLIAGMIRGDNPGVLSWFFTLLVLLCGHSINFALAALGAFVHPLRLTFVEFYKAVGFSGGGTPYKPYGGKKA